MPWAALAGVRQVVNDEAQAAIELENAIGEAREDFYPLDVRSGAAGPWIIDTKPMFAELLDDLRCHMPVSTVSAKFHQGLIEVFARIARQIREQQGLNRVCLSGGTFQNRFLAERLQQTARGAFIRGVCPLRGAGGRWRAEPGAGDGGRAPSRLAKIQRCSRKAAANVSGQAHPTAAADAIASAALAAASRNAKLIPSP